MASHWTSVSSYSLVIESNSPWKDEGRSGSRVVHGILAVEFGLLGYKTQSNRTTWWICVCSSHQWLTQSWHTQRLELAFQIVDLWIVDEFVVIPIHIGHIHLSDFDEPVLYGLDSCLWTGEFIEPALLVSGEISILCIILEIDTLFESCQVLDVQEVFGDGVCISRVVQDANR